MYKLDGRALRRVCVNAKDREERENAMKVEACIYRRGVDDRMIVGSVAGMGCKVGWGNKLRENIWYTVYKF